MQDKKKILMVSGGIDDQVGYDINIHNVSLQDKFGKYNVQNCVLIPSGQVKFPNSLSKTDIENAEKFDIFSACTQIKKMKIDVIFYIANTWRALTTYRAAFELLDIPIVSPSARCQELAFNKITTRAIMKNVGIKCAPGCIVTYEEKDNLDLILDKFSENNFSFPVIVKAPCDDDSLAVYVVKEKEDLIEKVNLALTFQNKSEILIEKFIPGRELRTAVIEGKNGEYVFLPSVEFQLKGPNDIRRLEDKQDKFLKDSKNIDHKKAERLFLDPKKEEKLVENLKQITFKSLKTVKIDDFGICDFRYDPIEDEIYLLEIGLANWFSYRSNITISAEKVGISQEEIIDNCFNNAVKRFNKAKNN